LGKESFLKREVKKQGRGDGISLKIYVEELKNGG